MTTYETIRVERRSRVGFITLNRPKVLNALNQELTKELLEAAETFDRDPAVGCILITGSDKAFAAGADINEMKDKNYIDMYGSDWFSACVRYWKMAGRSLRPCGSAWRPGRERARGRPRT